MAKNKPRRTSPLYLPGAYDLFAPSKNIVMNNLGVFSILYLLPFIYLLSSWASRTTQTTKDAQYASGLSFTGFPLYGSIVRISAIAIVGVVLTVMIQIMTNKAELDGAQGKKISMDKLWATLKAMGWRMLGLYIVMILVIFAGFILLIVPGFFMIRRYLLAPYVMLDKKCSISEAMEQSAKLSLINTSSVWGIIGVIILISFISIIPFIGELLSFVLGMLYSIAPAIRYTQLKKLT